MKKTSPAVKKLSDIYDLEILGDFLSSLIHLELSKSVPIKEANELLHICDEENPTFVVKSIKIFISPAHSQEEIIHATEAIKRAATILNDNN